VIEQTALAHAGLLRDPVQRHTSGADVSYNALGGFENPIARRTERRFGFDHGDDLWEKVRNCTGWTVQSQGRCAVTLWAAYIHIEI
jgi:hypothetical protein